MAEACANCGENLAGLYCAACGQKRMVDADRRLGHLVGQLLASATDLDGRFWRSMRALVLQPGRLSRDYLEGRRQYWMAPMTLFLLANVLYFVLPTGLSDFNLPLSDQMYGQPHAALTRGWVERRVAARDAARQSDWQRRPEGSRPASPPERYRLADYTAAYEVESGNVGKALIVVHLPFLALGLWAVFGRRRRYFAEHLVVATHQFTFLLLYLQLVLLPGAFLLDWLGLPGPGGWLLAFAMAWVGVHMAVGLRRVYDAPWWLAAVMPLPLLAWMMFCSVFFYRTLQFLVTYAVT